jgi:hypothetical protein
MASAAPSLSQRRILLFWLPLAASWLLMSTEMPFANAMIARLGEAARMLAAFGIVGSLSITIESPVIMLLATTTALARSRQNYLQLRRFTLHLMALTTLLHILVGWTPLFDVIVRGGMRVPESLVEPIRLGMRIMIFWSAAIGWRRFRQGVMIRFGQTRFVGQGTIVRLCASAGTAAVLALMGNVPGVAVGAYSLSVGVLVEAVYAHWVARQLVEDKFGATAIQPAQPDLTYRALVTFHTPLAASTLLLLLAQPLVSAALARLADPERVLAAWPVASGVLFFMRAPVFALPEVIIALMDEPHSHAPLREFSLRVGAVCLGALTLLAFTPIGHFYFRTLIDVNDDLAALAVTGAQVGVILPFIVALHSWFRGVLMSHKATAPVTVAMGLNLTVMAVTLALGVSLRAPGVALAALALILATSVETGWLWLATRRFSTASAISAINLDGGPHD